MRARTTAVGPELAAASGGSLDWEHAACISTSSIADAESWARACFERAPAPMRLFLVAGWWLLLLEGSSRSDATRVVGWPLVATTADTATLQRRSRLGIDATLVLSTRDGTATFASGMIFRNSFARVVWALVAPTHRWAVRVVLDHAASELALT